MAEEVVDGLVVKRSRKRVESVHIDKVKIADRIKNFYESDNQDRGPDIDARLQRYAKFRMWSEGKNWPWEGATDFALPDLMTACAKMEDTLHNAVMSQRPPIMAKAMRKAFKEKEEKVNNLLDFQFFEEQPGEEIVGQLSNDFVLDGLFTAYTPWIDEHRTVCQVKVFPAIPDQAQPFDVFQNILKGTFPQGELKPSKDGWDWTIINDGKRHTANFFSKDSGEIELELTGEVQVFDGPRAIRKDVQDVLHPARCENLQIPGPSNPLGASHVILRDFPTIDEIQRLKDDGFYDLITDDEAETLGIRRMDTGYQQREEQKDTMQGHSEMKDKPKGAESHKTLTRLMCFDCFDINGDGLDEDVIFWMILETKTLLRAKYLTQMFPSNPPRRPFGEAGFFPVPGRRLAIGMLEMMESSHDIIKQFIDQGGDAGTIANAPFGFYRASSNMRPEVIRLWPGEMYPLTDPKNDVSFPNLGNQNQSFMFNFVGLLSQMEDKLSTIGDLQVGRVPQGKSSALRTVAGMQTVLAQGDSRPERILRRFFMGLAQIFQNFHALNEVYLSGEKQFMICGDISPNEQAYDTTNREGIKGKYRFTFSANALNTSKEALQAALQDIMGIVVSPLNIQLGLSKPDGIYRLQRDFIKAKGQDPDKYITPPSPEAMLPPITAEDAVAMIMDGAMPQGSPMEGLDEHFAKLQEFMQSDDFGHLGDVHIPLFRAYLEQVAQKKAQAAQQAMVMQAAAQFQQGAQPDGKPGPVAGPQGNIQGMPPVQGGELADESLPGAGGGANQAPQ